MKFSLYFTKLIFISLFCSTTMAAGLESAEIFLSSNSGKSVVISRGRIHGLKDGQHATFFLQEGSLNFPKLVKLAEGEVIRSLDNKSYWFLHKIYNGAKIKRKAKIVLDVKSKHLRGTRDFVVTSRKRIYPDTSSSKKITYENQKGIPKNLVREEDKYIESEELFETKIPNDHDIEIHQFDIWAKRKGLTKVDDFMKEFEDKFVDENFKLNDISKEESEKIKTSMYRAQIDGFLSKINSQKYGLSGMYYHQAKEQDMILIRKRMDIDNVYTTSRKNKKRKQILNQSKIEKIERDGKLWSSDFSDEGLRRYMVQTGIEQEERRQYESLTQKSGNELSFRISSGLVSHSTSDDQNHQNKGYSLSLGYEYHLMRTSPSLLNWSIEVFMQRSIENIDLGGINGRFAGGSFGTQLFYYFYNNPASLMKWSWYGGLGIRRGNSSVTSVELSSEYDFQVTGLPIWSIGTKYRFKTGDSFDDDIPVGAGLNIRLSGERMELSSTSQVVDDINSTSVINDIKLTVGLSFYF